MKFTALQREVLLWYRARRNGERVTLASLHRRGVLDRRGALGAYEYQLPWDTFHVRT